MQTQINGSKTLATGFFDILFGLCLKHCGCVLLAHDQGKGTETGHETEGSQNKSHNAEGVGVVANG